MAVMIWFRLLCWSGLGIDQILKMLKTQNPGWFYGIFYFIDLVIFILILVDVCTIYSLNKMPNKFVRKLVTFSSFVSLLASITGLVFYPLTPNHDILKLGLLLAILIVSMISQAYADKKKIGLTERTQQFADPADIIFEKAKLNKSEDDNSQNS